MVNMVVTMVGGQGMGLIYRIKALLTLELENPCLKYSVKELGTWDSMSLGIL